MHTIFHYKALAHRLKSRTWLNCTYRQSGTVNQITSSQVPVMIICTGDGWDLISPPGWAMSLWQCLTYSGAKVSLLIFYLGCYYQSIMIVKLLRLILCGTIVAETRLYRDHQYTWHESCI